MSTHRDIEGRFDDLLRGVLSEPERRETEEHLASCPECSEEFAHLRALLEGARGLPREMEPDRDLWSGVEARIGDLDRSDAAPCAAQTKAAGPAVPTHSTDAPQSTNAALPARWVPRSRWVPTLRPRIVWATALAAAVVALTFAWWPSGEPGSLPGDETVAGRLPGDLPPAGRDGSSADRSPADRVPGDRGSLPVSGDPEGRSSVERSMTDLPGAFEVVSDAPLFIASLVRGLELQCVGAGRELRASIDGSANQLGAAMTEALESDVQVLDRAIAETRSALEENPEDPGLLQMLTSRYQRKLSILQQAMRLAGEA